MAARRGAASLSFDQSVLVAEAAEAMAAYALKQSNGSTDDFSSPWAQPFGPTEIIPGVVLQASLEDLQGRFNLNSLIAKDQNLVAKLDPGALETFRTLLEMLDLEPKWANEIADWIHPSPQPQSTTDGLDDSATTSQTPPYRVADTFITSTSELLALPGFGRERYLKLAPYVVALPLDATFNVCTASGQLLDAGVGPGFKQFSADPGFAEARKKACTPSKSDYANVVNTGPNRNTVAATNLLQRVDVKSRYFRLTSLITIGDSEFTLYSLIRREKSNGPVNIRVLQRSFTPD